MKQWLISILLSFTATAVGAETVASIPAAQLNIQIAPLSYEQPKNSADYQQISISIQPDADDSRQTLMLSRQAYLRGEDIASATVVPATLGGFSINLTFTPAGAHRFATLTRENIGRSIAIIDQKQQYLLFNFAVYDEISGGEVQLSAISTPKLARQIVDNKHNISFHLVADDAANAKQYQEVSLQQLPQSHNTLPAWLYRPWRIGSEDMEQLVIEKMPASTLGEWAESLSVPFYYKARLILNRHGVKKRQHHADTDFYLLIPGQDGHTRVSGIISSSNHNSMDLNIFLTLKDAQDFMQAVRAK